MAFVRSEKNASTKGRLKGVGSARKRVAERAAFAMATSGVAMMQRGKEHSAVESEETNQNYNNALVSGEVVVVEEG